MKRALTDENIEALTAKRKRYLVYDTSVPGLAVRVSPKGKKTFVVVGRFNGNKHPTRRSLGVFGRVSLERARDKARHAYKDPHSSDTFGDVAERYFHHIQRQRRGSESERCIRRELLPQWGSRPISSITKRDMIAAVDAVKSRGSPSAAHHLLSYARRLFNYAVDRDLIEHSPCERLKAGSLIGRKVIRQRVLTDEEIKSLWIAAHKMGYPYGPLCQLLLITGQRRGEIAGSRWAEIRKDVLVIPPERFKSDATHLVPLSEMALRLINSLPRDSDHLFGHVAGWSKLKRRLDHLMGEPAPWALHDIRRTVRTRMSGLRIRAEVAEMVIGHGKKGLARVYDQHEYMDEMREALEQWATRLREIVAGGAIAQ